MNQKLSSDNLILRLAKAAGEVLGKTHDELMYAFGVYMVKRIGNYGYERILKVTCLKLTPAINVRYTMHIFITVVLEKSFGSSFIFEGK